MKKLITKSLFIAFLCFAVMPSPMQAGLRNKATGALACCALGGFAAYKFLGSFGFLNKGSKNDLHDVVRRKCENVDLEAIEKNAREIFEGEDAQKHIPKRFFKVDIKFMEEFRDFCRGIKDIGGEEAGINTTVYHMAENYLTYLKKSYLSKRDMLFTCLGAGGTAIAFSKIKNNNLIMTSIAMTSSAVVTHIYGNKIINGFKQFGSKVINGFKQLGNKFKKKNA